jgi:hypothetical protein
VTVKRVMVAFGISLAVSVLVLLPFQLDRHHHASHKVGVQVGAGIVMDLGVTDARGARTGKEAEASFGGR